MSIDHCHDEGANAVHVLWVGAIQAPGESIAAFKQPQCGTGAYLYALQSEEA